MFHGNVSNVSWKCKNVSWKCKNVCFPQDLIKYTPEEHPDFELLKTFMKHAQEFLEKNYNQQPEVDVSTEKKY